MGARNSDLERRLEAYFATLRSYPLAAAVRRSARQWQLYAAVTGSAMAMATTTAAALLASGRDARAEMEQAAAAEPHFTRSSQLPLMEAARLAVARRAEAAQATAELPTISSGGVVPIFGVNSVIQAGEWVTIYGSNLANGTYSWNGDFPLSLGGTSVEIDGKSAYLMYASPGQINLQAPDDTATGQVAVVVTTGAGSATSTVTLSQYAPAFILVQIPQSKAMFVSGIILRPDGSGTYAAGSYDILGPTGDLFGYPTVAAQPGDMVELYAVGFGPTTSPVPAGKPFAGATAITSPITVTINNIQVRPSFVGISSTGVYQINLTVPPGLGEGDVPIRVTVGGLETQPDVVFPLARIEETGGGTVGTVGGGVVGTFPFIPSSGFGTWTGTDGGPGGGTGGPGGGTGGGGGSGGGSAAISPSGKKPWTPKLRFPNE